MNDKELADAALKATGWHPEIRNQVGYRGDSQFVNDWRVAGALLEKMPCMAISAACQQSDDMRYHGWLKDPRTVIEKCVEWLQ